jgi:hypothetical protein
MFPGVHDSQVLAYSADSRVCEVLLHLRAGPEGAPLFDLKFNGAVAHQFPYPQMPSWVFGLTSIPARELLEREWSVIAEGFRLVGWPGNWAETLEKAVSYCEAAELTGFDLESSFGIEGWVLARSVERVDVS